jgi:hypothetical protein
LRLYPLARIFGKFLAKSFLRMNETRGGIRNNRVNTGDLWWAWVDLNHRPRPYQGTTVRSHNDLQDLQEPRGLPKYLQVVQDIANCGLDCGLEITCYERLPYLILG